MFKYEDFKEWLSTEDAQSRLVSTYHRIANKIGSGTANLEDILGLGDSWENMALIYKLEELGLVRVDRDDIARTNHYKVSIKR